MTYYVAVTTHNFLLWLGSFGGFALLVFILALVPLGGKSIVGSIGTMLNARAARIDAQLRMAEENQAAARKAHDEAQAEIAHAHAEAEDIVKRAQSMRSSLSDELAAAAEKDKIRIVGQARDEIEAERNRAILELRSRAADLAVDAAREVLKRTMDENTDRQLITRALAEDATTGRAS